MREFVQFGSCCIETALCQRDDASRLGFRLTSRMALDKTVEPQVQPGNRQTR